MQAHNLQPVPPFDVDVTHLERAVAEYEAAKAKRREQLAQVYDLLIGIATRKVVNDVSNSQNR